MLANRLAICALAKNEAPYIEEWLAFHLLQGASEFVIFDNESTDGTRELLARIALRAPVHVCDWPYQNYYAMQQEAYAEGAGLLSGRADWAAFIDIDEFLFSSRGYPLPLELGEFGSDVGAVAVGHRVFGSSGHIAYEAELVTRRFTRCAGPDHPQSRWFKTIARPASVESFDSAHSVILRSGTYLTPDHAPLHREDLGWHPGYADRVARGTISLFHYMVKSREEYRWKQSRFAGKQLEHRYTDEFFREHDEIGNETENSELRRFSDPIRALIAQWH